MEVYRKIPLMDEIINNKIPCCVLTDQNFIIQSFTPNCMEYLQLKDNHISNYDIINNIKEFHDDYVIDFNTTHMSRNFTGKENFTVQYNSFCVDAVLIYVVVVVASLLGLIIIAIIIVCKCYVSKKAKHMSQYGKDGEESLVGDTNTAS